MYDPIQINGQSEFFIAICKFGMHSYVTLGVKNGEKVNVLAAVGKVAGYNASLCGLYLWDTEAFMKNERFMFEPKDNQVDYKAYAINYQHYLEFINYLQKLSYTQKAEGKVNFKLQAYFADPGDPNNLQYRPVDQFTMLDQPVVGLDAYARIGILGNSCRHGAINLIQKLTGQNELGNGISSSFFKSLPLKMVIFDGKVMGSTPYFYILPLPPTAFVGMLPAQLRIISQLYRRLDKIFLSAQDNPATIEKFSKLKDLYNDLTRDQHVSLDDLMNGIEQWEVANKKLISTHRESHWISFQTATEKMFSNLHEEFQKLRANPPADAQAL